MKQAILKTQTIDLGDFISEFKGSLLASLNRSNPSIYNEDNASGKRQEIMDSLIRKPFTAQAHVVQAITTLLLDKDEPAGIINAEMGTGKTMMAIAAAYVLFNEANYRRHLIISPPHLVYKWRREILQTVPGAKVWVLNGADTLMKLLMLRDTFKTGDSFDGPEFFILGRVRMRMGYHWRNAFVLKKLYQKHNAHNDKGEVITRYTTIHAVSCSDCFHVYRDDNGEPYSIERFNVMEKRIKCPKCANPLWTLMRPTRTTNSTFRDRVKKSMCQIPTIGPVKSESLLSTFGDDFISNMLSDNASDFVNLMDPSGDFIFTDKQARRMERALANLEFGFGEGTYQATEFIKRYLPKGFFDMLIVDESHEYKNQGSAQGQAMGVLASQVKKVLLLTGTLMGGYADDLFVLLFRALTSKMIEDGYTVNNRGSLGSASMKFMEDHGILKEVFTERNGMSHKTAKGNQITRRTQKAPGFGPKGILRYVLPFTVFLKLKDIGDNVLPMYKEEYMEVAMTEHQRSEYDRLSSKLSTELKSALRKRDTTLMGVVLNVLLAWPDCCARDEEVRHPRTKDSIIFVPAVFDNMPDPLGNIDCSPKEERLVELCLAEKANGRKTLVYTTYTGTRDLTPRLRLILAKAGLKVTVLKSSEPPEKREDWILDKVDRGYDVVLTNPELVKTGLDLLDFPTIVFLQTGFNVYTLQQAAKRSFRIGQKNEVKVIYLGYENSAQTRCLSLMAKKIAVSQSTSGDMPDSGLDILNSDGDSIEIELAKQLIA
ncbi:DEAD/DEAH box helicase [Orbus sturtevantii]|uniref:SNF2-related protein n=1 Tax=Orbus sturtevantii TaxID=3074109 RepID=UPI00370DCF4E